MVHSSRRDRATADASSDVDATPADREPTAQVVEFEDAGTVVTMALYDSAVAGPAPGHADTDTDTDHTGASDTGTPHHAAGGEHGRGVGRGGRGDDGDGSGGGWIARLRRAAAGPPDWPMIRLVALGVVIVVAVATAGVLAFAGRAPTIDELRRRAAWTDVQELKVGVSGDVPGVSECLPGKECTGFDVEIAKLMADWLGVPRSNVEFYEVLPENRYRMLGTRPGTTTTVRLDMVVAGFSITDERVEKDHVVFAGPYLSTETTVLTRRDHAVVESLVALDSLIQDGGKLRRQRVCTPGTSTSAIYLGQEVKVAQIVPQQRNSDCVRMVRDGTVDAAVTDAAILAGFQARYPKELRLNNIASAVDENWGIGLGRDFGGTDDRLRARRQLLLLAMEDLRTAPGQQAWEDAFRQLPPTIPEPNQEVQVVAIDEQPAPNGLEPVRRWPWERTGTGTGR